MKRKRWKVRVKEDGWKGGEERLTETKCHNAKVLRHPCLAPISR